MAGLVDFAVASNVRKMQRRFPWETGPMARIFRGGAGSGSQDATPVGSVAMWLRGSEELEVERAPGRRPPCGGVLSFLDADVGEAPDLEDNNAADYEELQSSVRDVLAKKAEATLRARESALRAFLRWCSAQGVNPWPPHERLG